MWQYSHSQPLDAVLRGFCCGWYVYIHKKSIPLYRSYTVWLYRVYRVNMGEVKKESLKSGKWIGKLEWICMNIDVYVNMGIYWY